MFGGGFGFLEVKFRGFPDPVGERGELGRAGINITDMSLSPSPDNSSGVVSLWLAEAKAGEGADLIRGLGIHVA